MPVTMPYHLEVGHSLRALERVLNHPEPNTRRALRRSALKDLRDDTVAVDRAVKNLRDTYSKLTPTGTKPAIVVQNETELDRLAERLALVWLARPPATGVVAQPPAQHVDRWYDSADLDDLPNSPVVGWRYYRGQVERILRFTLRLAIESASELKDSAAPIGPTAPAWPMIIMWKCAQPWFEGWVQWRTVKDVRTVVVVICTPPDGNHVGMKPTLGYLESPDANLPQQDYDKEKARLAQSLLDATVDGFTMTPAASSADEMVVVTEHEHHLDATVAMSTRSTRPATSIAGSYNSRFDGAPWPWFGGKFFAKDNAVVVRVGTAGHDGGV